MRHLVRVWAIGSAAGALAACAGPVAPARMPQAPVASGAYRLDPAADGSVRITRTAGDPFGYAEGLAARQAADALCGAGGVRSSIRDRFEGGAWVFPEGCA